MVPYLKTNKQRKLSSIDRAVTTVVTGVFVIALMFFYSCGNKNELPVDSVSNGIVEPATYFLNGIILTFDPKTGDLMGIVNGDTGLYMESGYVDVGISASTADLSNGSWLRGTIDWQNYDVLAPWELPSAGGFETRAEESPPTGEIEAHDGYIKVTQEIYPIKIQTIYNVVNMIVEISADVTNISDDKITINGMSFAKRNIAVRLDSFYMFAGTLPAGTFPAFSGNRHTRFSSPVTQLEIDENFFNLMFINEDEKWVTRAVGTAARGFNLLNVTSVLSHLDPGESLLCGYAYIQLVPPGNCPFEELRGMYSAKGWAAPTDGVKDGPIFSAWPLGTTDGVYGITQEHPVKLGQGNDYHLFNGAEGVRGTSHLDDFSVRLADIASWGFEILWLLPLYDFPGSDLYNPNNMENIDERFGGNEAAAPGSAFRVALKDTGLIFMTDFVPHGPRWHSTGSYSPTGNYNFDTTNPWFNRYPHRTGWVARNLSGSYRQVPDWRSVAMDYANPDYLAYMKDLAKTQVDSMGISGARIDAVMDTAPNWAPVYGMRPSNANMKGSALMSKAIRDGILDAGIAPAMLPETFHPVPFIAPHTDFFYDMAFCEFIIDLANRSGSDSVMFARETARFLDTQQKSMPEGLVHARFLANHDTVSSWYTPHYPGLRAWEFFGLERARALWVLLATIDGVPKVYQGDELMGNDKFFTELFNARKKYLGTSFDIEYFHERDSQIIAFMRRKGDLRRLVLVNLGEGAASRDLSHVLEPSCTLSLLYAEDASSGLTTNPVNINGRVITLEPYSSVIIDIKN